MNKVKKRITILLFSAFAFLSAYTMWLGYSYCISSKQSQDQVISEASENQSLTETDPLFKHSLDISLGLFFSLCLLVALLGILWCTQAYQWWIVVTIISLLTIGEIGFIWFRTSQRKLLIHKDHFFVANKEALNAFLQEFDYPKKGFTAVPTSILINHAIFSRRDNEVYPGVLVKGQVWQRYTDGLHDSLERMILLPDMYYGSISEIYKKREGVTETVGWSFSGAFFQHFDISAYPFDHRHMKLQILHKNFEQNVMCIPDFDSYYTSNPDQFIGIDKELAIPHWNLDKSLFSYTVHDYGSTLGIKEFFNSQFPQCYFYLIVARKLMDSFMIYLFLLLIAAIILFVSLMTFLKHTTLTNLVGFSTIGILGVCSALLFVLISNQTNMRENLSIEGTSYLDYLYFVLYMFIAFVTMNSISFVINEHINIIQYRNNIVAKLLYWPLLLFSVLGVTLAVFY